MNKTETERAKVNIKHQNKAWKKKDDWNNRLCEMVRADVHKATCQRFLDILSEICRNHPKINDCNYCNKRLRKLCEDLEQTIKLYKNDEI